ncbi:MAG: hypothetical protein QM296_08940 [Bacillota bacterium]|nr:hypothetical protein [Bacillota bacterium]
MDEVFGKDRQDFMTRSLQNYHELKRKASEQPLFALNHFAVGWDDVLASGIISCFIKGKSGLAIVMASFVDIAMAVAIGRMTFAVVK